MGDIKFISPRSYFLCPWKMLRTSAFWEKRLQCGWSQSKVRFVSGINGTKTCLVQIHWLKLWKGFRYTAPQTSWHSSRWTRQRSQTLICSNNGQSWNCCDGWARLICATRAAIHGSCRCIFPKSSPSPTLLPGLLTLSNLLIPFIMCLSSKTLIQQFSSTFCRPYFVYTICIANNDFWTDSTAVAKLRPRL